MPPTNPPPASDAPRDLCAAEGCRNARVAPGQYCAGHTPGAGGAGEAGEIDPRRAREKGQVAAMCRHSDETNPYREGSPAYCAWQSGYWAERSHRERCGILRAIVGDELDRNVDYDAVEMVKNIIAERDALRLSEECANNAHARAECHLTAIYAMLWPDDPHRWIPGEVTAEGVKIFNGVAKVVAERDALRAACKEAVVFMEMIGNPAPPHPWMQLRAALARVPAAGEKAENPEVS